MKIDGLQLLEGSQITNPVVAHGTSFPTGPANPPDIGELFYLTSGDVGLHYCSQVSPTTVWIKIASAEMDPDLVAIAELSGLSGFLKKTAANTWTLDTSAYLTSVAFADLTGKPTTLSGYGITDAYTQAQTDAAISAATPTFASLTGKPTTLGGYGITDGQPLDGDLSSIAGLAGTSGILTKTGANTWALDTNTYLTAHPSVSGATSANNSGLTYVQDLTFDANGHVTGIQSVAIQSASISQAGVAQLSDSTSTTSSVLAATSTAVKSAYDVASAALPKAGGSMTGSIVIPTGQHISLTDAPSAGTDAVNKNYVDGNLAGLTWKNSVKAATNGNITLSGAQTVDGVALVAGDRVLVKNQTTASANGIYVVAAGAWTRSTDMDATTPINEVNSAAVFVEGGTTFADTGWTQVNNVSTLDTDAIAFTQFNGASGITAGVGLVKSGNTLDVNLGAGIAQLPTDEVGVDVYATGGLMTTVDGTTSSTLTNAQLSLVKVGTAGTYKSVTTDDFGRITAGSNPTTLAGYGITDAQSLDADLTAIAALAGTSGFLKKTAANTWSLDTTTYATDSLAMHLAGAETATGLKTFSAGIKLPDASTFYLGTDNDLALSHSGSAGTITNNTNALTIHVNNVSGSLNLTTGGGSVYVRSNNTSGSYLQLSPTQAWLRSGDTYITTQGGTQIARFVSGAISLDGSVDIGGSINVSSGSTGYFNVGTVGFQAPAIAVGGTSSPHASQYTKDKGVRFYYNNGANKFGFFGYKHSTGKFTFIPDASYNADIFSGTKGTIDAYLAWTDITGKPTTLSGYGITDTLQPLDADLTAIAALAGTSGYLKKTAADTWTLDTATLATDSNVVHIAGTETITGAKTFSSDINLIKADSGARLDIQNTSSTASRWPGLNIINYNGGFTGGYPVVELVSHRGSSAAPTAVQSGDILGSIGGWGYNGTIVNDAARIYFTAASNFNGTNDDGSIEFWTQSGTTLTKRMSVNAGGGTSFFPGTITNNFYVGATGDVPFIAFDSSDYVSYDRTNNKYDFVIGNVSELTLTSTTATFGTDVTVNGNITANGTTTTVNTNNTTVTVDTCSATTYRSAEYLVQAVRAGGTAEFNITKVLITHDGTTVYLAEYGQVSKSAMMGTLDAVISGGNILLQYSGYGNATVNNIVVKVVRTAILA
jgi:hypothetical protein